MKKTVGSEFKLPGVKHVHLVCNDIARTSLFYRDALGMRLTQSVDLPDGAGRRVVFDVGDGALLAFVWFRSERSAELCAPDRQPEPGDGARITAHGRVDYISFDVSAERFDEYRQHMKDRGVPASLAFRPDERSTRAGEAVNSRARRRALYCLDPDGVALEFASQPTPPVARPQTALAPMPPERTARPTAALAYA